MVTCCRKLLGILLLSWLCAMANAQQRDSLAAPRPQDSGFLSRMRLFGKRETISSIEKYRNGKGNTPRAVWNGLVSNVKAFVDKAKCSSLIYVISK